jgi:hypothetical protein
MLHPHSHRLLYEITGVYNVERNPTLIYPRLLLIRGTKALAGSRAYFLKDVNVVKLSWRNLYVPTVNSDGVLTASFLPPSQKRE